MDNDIHPETTEQLSPLRSSANPLLERFNTMPAETFRLPSNGVLYTNGEIDPEVINGEVIIYPMTTVDEITMRSPDMLYQGTAIENVFKRCMPQIKKPLDLLSNDVDYLLICLRMVTYGAQLDIRWDCPECAKTRGDTPTELTTSHVREGEIGDDEVLNVAPSFSVDLNSFLKLTRPLDMSSDVFTIPLDTGEVIKLRPSTFREMLKLYQHDSSTLSTPEELTDFVLDGVLAVVDSVNGHNNKEHIREWGLRCEAPVLEVLQNEIHKANDWGTSYTYNFTCDKCKHSATGDIPLNPIQFFTSPSTNPIKV